MKSFEFHRPQSVADAVALLQGNASAKLLAGGQSLIPVLKLDLAQPEGLVSLAAIRGLKEIRDGDPMVIGALATHDEVASSPVVRQRIPGLATVAGGIGDAQVRNRGTLGGSLGHADPAADYPAAVLALGATVETDRRRIAADDYFTGLFSTALAEDEVIVAVHFPVPQCSAYAKFASPASKYAVAGVMVAKTAGGVRVAVTGAGLNAFRVPAWEAALAASFSPDSIDPGAVSPADLRSDAEASAEYRAHLVTVLARRAVQACR
ncbi:MAG TPA: FAD binding domain-containing protein [Thermoanaerobaculia bacterium]|nr:FAD binding domain-containing protein [Thermoanaerobaculia bacterium]